MSTGVVRKEGETGGKGYSKLRMIDKDKKKPIIEQLENIIKI